MSLHLSACACACAWRMQVHVHGAYVRAHGACARTCSSGACTAISCEHMHAPRVHMPVSLLRTCGMQALRMHVPTCACCDPVACVWRHQAACVFSITQCCGMDDPHPACGYWLICMQHARALAAHMHAHVTALHVVLAGMTGMHARFHACSLKRGIIESSTRVLEHRTRVLEHRMSRARANTTYDAALALLTLLHPSFCPCQALLPFRLVSPCLSLPMTALASLPPPSTMAPLPPRRLQPDARRRGTHKAHGRHPRQSRVEAARRAGAHASGLL